MKKTFSLGNRAKFGAGLIGFALLCLPAHAPRAIAQCPNPSSGPDIVASDLNYFGLYSVMGSGMNATGSYGMTVVACNVGNVRVNTFSSTNQHPVFVQNVYRLKTVQGAGRFEQIGMSWAVHSRVYGNPPTVPVANPCCTCGGSLPHPLSPGCSNSDTAQITTNASYLGPRSEVNPATGQFPYPYVLGWQQDSNVLHKRLQVRLSDYLSQPAGTLFFGEAQYVTADDALAGNKNNNASYRRLAIYLGPIWPPELVVAFNAATQRNKPAIQAWQDADAVVQIVNIDVPNDGRLIVAWKVTNTAPNLYHYEYAIQNLTSDRSVQAFTVPFSLTPGGAYEIGFHDINYHSGEPYSSNDWAVTIADEQITWATDTFAVNPNANALRWGTLYNFRFDSPVPPTQALVNATIRLFKPGTPTEMQVPVQVPNLFDCNNNWQLDYVDIAAGSSQDCNVNAVPDECEPAADVNGNDVPDICECLNCKGDANQDERIDGRDIELLVKSFVGNTLNHCVDMDNSLTLTHADLTLFVAATIHANPPCAP